MTLTLRLSTVPTVNFQKEIGTFRDCKLKYMETIDTTSFHKSKKNKHRTMYIV